MDNGKPSYTCCELSVIQYQVVNRRRNMKVYFLLNFFGFFNLVAAGGGPKVRTTSGIVEGLNTESPWGNVVAFYGIPYSSNIPIGKYRFKPSEPIINPLRGKSRVNTFTQPPACPQPIKKKGSSHPWLSSPSNSFNEDCLNLNVFLPLQPVGPSNLFQILILVPGSDLNSADTREYNAFALTFIGRIIVITINYRVGAFGFLSTGNKTVEGNAGISDILSALEWVKLNGEAFGGNTSAITVGGLYAGSMLLSAAITSPRFAQKSLAQRVILHGGICTGHWNLETEPKKSFENLVRNAGCATDSIEEAMICLQHIPTDLLLEASAKTQEFWKPVLDKSLIVGDPLELIEFGKYPTSLEMMIGENSGSGSVCYSVLRDRNSSYITKIETDKLNVNDLSTLIEQSLMEYFKTGDDSLTAAVLHEYLYAGIPENSYRDTLIHFCGTLYIRNPMELLARYASRFQPRVFRYEFSFHSTSSPLPPWLGAAIGDELPFLFPISTDLMSVEDIYVFQNFSGSWINFVRNGMPGQSTNAWPEFDEETKDMIVFTFRGLKLDSSRFLDRDVHFWRETFKSLRTAAESCSIYKSESLHNLCRQLELPEDKVYNATNYFLVFLIFIGILTLIGLGFFIHRIWKKNKVLFK